MKLSLGRKGYILNGIGFAIMLATYLSYLNSYHIVQPHFFLVLAVAGVMWGAGNWLIGKQIRADETKGYWETHKEEK
jgi:hypothetical protein